MVSTRRAVTATVIAMIASTLMVLGTPTTASALDSYTPPRGVLINNPLGDQAHKRTIWNHIVRTIRSVPRGGKIRIASWNVRSPGAERALIYAHKRGVSVRVIMDQKNTENNSGFRKLARALREGQANRRKDMKSWAVVCYSSCRHAGGIAHTKFFLFSRAGKARNITMYGSGNLTDLAATNQWDDLFTVQSTSVYNYMLAIFNQMTYDQNRANPFSTRLFWGTDLYDWMRIYIFPWAGANTPGDPVLTVLNNIKCTGAAPGVGSNGHTVVRIAQTATTGARGLRITNKLVDLKKHGCIIRMIYTLMGKQSMAAMRAGGVPFHQVVKDYNHDYVYETYLHTKVLTVNGVYQDRTDARETWNGSSNWTGLSLGSDETFVHLKSASVTKRYDDFIDRWFNHPPVTARMPASYARAGVNPYALVEVN